MLRFDMRNYDPLAAAAVVPVDDAESLMKRLFVAGCRVLAIDWDRVGLVELPVEDDVIFICEAYSELPVVTVDGGTQHVFLGDGVLELEVTVSGDLCHIAQSYCPYLHRHFLETCDYVVSVEKYVAAWHHLVRDIRSLHAATEVGRSV